MNGELSEQFDEVIRTEMDNLRHLKVGSLEYERAVDGLAKLYKVRADEREKQERLDFEDRQHGDELVIKEEEMRTDRKHRWIKVVLDTASVVLPLGVYGACYLVGLRFEETGTITSVFEKQNLAQLFRLKR